MIDRSLSVPDIFMLTKGDFLTDEVYCPADMREVNRHRGADMVEEAMKKCYPQGWNRHHLARSYMRSKSIY